MTVPRLARSAAALLAALLLLAACAPAATPPPATLAPAAEPPAATLPPAPVPTASAAVAATPAATSSPTPSPAPTPTAAASPSPRTARPAPTATPAGPTVAGFWSRVRDAVERAGGLEVEIAGPNAAVLRFTQRTSATVVDGVVGFVCVGGRAYDGQSGFTALPGAWTCGAPALVSGFRSIGQPIDAWSDTLPVDRGRSESVAAAGGRWTWRYRATSPYYGGAVSATVTIDAATGRVVAARREDPTGGTRYTFHYGVEFPPITVPD